MNEEEEEESFTSSANQLGCTDELGLSISWPPRSAVQQQLTLTILNSINAGLAKGHQVRVMQVWCG